MVVLFFFCLKRPQTPTTKSRTTPVMTNYFQFSTDPGAPPPPRSHPPPCRTIAPAAHKRAAAVAAAAAARPARRKGPFQVARRALVALRKIQMQLELVRSRNCASCILLRHSNNMTLLGPGAPHTGVHRFIRTHTQTHAHAEWQSRKNYPLLVPRCENNPYL